MAVTPTQILRPKLSHNDKFNADALERMIDRFLMESFSGDNVYYECDEERLNDAVLGDLRYRYKEWEINPLDNKNGYVILEFAAKR